MRPREEVREHIGRIMMAGHGRTDLPVEPRVISSWRRSLEHYSLDPGLATAPRVVTATMLRDHRERLETFARIAMHGVGKLHEQVRDANYCVLLTDAEGVTTNFLGVPALDRELKQEGFRVGVCWSEDVEGTCGVGTSIVDRKPLLVHKTEHFRAHNIPFTCSSAPMFGPRDELLGILDASALHSPDDRRSQALVFNLVCSSALLIENAFFLDSYRENWVLHLSRAAEFLDVQLDYLIAFDDAGRVVGANRKARCELLSRGSGPVCRLEDIFDLSCDASIRLAHDRPGLAIPMHVHATGERYFAMLRAPASAALKAAMSTPSLRVAHASNTGAAAFSRLAIGDAHMLAQVEQAKRLANRRIPILLLGETGSGKEAFAKSIHRFSDRREEPFIALNCAAIPESLIESELFGYREGAFTGAKAKGTKGKILQANGGTLFLDEIGDMPLPLQSRLLRVLAEGEVLPLGAESPIHVDLHVICATHRDLAEMLAAGEFREDLFYRLNAAMFRIPPLRERSDLAQIIAHVLADEIHEAGRNLQISPEAQMRLANYRWPGNIRQLRNAIRYAAALCEGDLLGMEHFPPEVLGLVGALPPPVAGGALQATVLPRQTSREMTEGEQMVQVLRRNGWQVTISAKQMGIPRATFYRRMKRFNIVAPNRADQEA